MSGGPPTRPHAAAPALDSWLRTQAVNVTRHAAALRPFRRGEFGTGIAAPTVGHLEAANAVIVALRRGLLRQTQRVRDAAQAATAAPSHPALARVVSDKEAAHDLVREIERVWDFYFELFGQRQTRYGYWLVGCDRIALDCYQTAYVGLPVARSIPAPAAFCYMQTGFSPATFRRGVRVRRLGRQLNPFPLIQLPYHRLVNPWTLGAVLHEVSHNLHNDLGLERAVPERIAATLREAGMPRSVAATWVRWNRELFADMAGLLLGGPEIVGSLMDVVGRSPRTTVTYSPHGPHPTPYLRTFVSIELLRRMGFPDEAEQYRRAWERVYPSGRGGGMPPRLLATFPAANARVVNAVCFEPFPQLGGHRLVDVLRFHPKDQRMTEEAAGRLAAGNDPGVIPARLLIAAARIALERRLARPQAIATNFYDALVRR